MITKIEYNNEKNGVEIYFDGPPSKDVLAKLNKNKFQFHGVKRCWYIKQKVLIEGFIGTLLA